MNIDHLFIFSEDKGESANELLAFGLTEGSSRVHAGQGTANRKFYFDNFFLEVLWVHDAKEMENEQIRATGLVQRAFDREQYSPFGLCVVNTPETDALFEHAYAYQPSYFPQGSVIDVLKNEQQPGLPWIFRLPFKGQNPNLQEPKSHKNGLKCLTKACFEWKGDTENEVLKYFENHDQIEFKISNRNWLHLYFDYEIKAEQRDFEQLFLTIHY